MNWPSPVSIACALVSGFCVFKLGYNWPRDLELESLKPVEFHFQINSDAAKYLLLRDGPKCEAPISEEN